MDDLYLIPNSTVLKNLLGITNEKSLIWQRLNSLVQT